MAFLLSKVFLFLEAACRALPPDWQDTGTNIAWVSLVGEGKWYIHSEVEKAFTKVVLGCRRSRAAQGVGARSTGIKIRSLSIPVSIHGSFS
jgi:hypothetical protein